MPRIRSIKPSVWTDEKLEDLAPIHRLVFLALVSLADDAGRLVDSVKGIDGAIFAATDDTCAESLNVLAGRSRIIRYCGRNGQRVIEIANWSKHQRISHPYPSALPSNDLPCSGMKPEPNQNHSDRTTESFVPDVEVEVEEIKDVKIQIGREASPIAARAVTGPRRPNGGDYSDKPAFLDTLLSAREIHGTTAYPSYPNAKPQGANGHPATETPMSLNRPESDVPIIPRPPAVPEPADPITSLAPNGEEPYLAERRAAAVWVKANPDAYAELQRQVAAENPHSAAAGENGEGRKRFLSALLLGRITRILAGFDHAPALAIVNTEETEAAV